MPNRATVVETSPTSHIVTIHPFLLPPPSCTVATTAIGRPGDCLPLGQPRVCPSMPPRHHPQCRHPTTPRSACEPTMSPPITAPNDIPEPATSPPKHTAQECPERATSPANNTRTTATSSLANDDNDPNDNDNRCHVTAEGPSRR